MIGPSSRICFLALGPAMDAAFHFWRGHGAIGRRQRALAHEPFANVEMEFHRL